MSNQAKNYPLPTSIQVKSLFQVINITTNGVNTGGTLGQHGTNIFIPAGSHVVKAYIEKLDAFASENASGTVSFDLLATGDIKSAVAPDSSFTSDINGLNPTGVPSSMLKNTSTTDKELKYTISTSKILKGKYNLYVEYK